MDAFRFFKRKKKKNTSNDPPTIPLFHWTERFVPCSIVVGHKMVRAPTPTIFSVSDVTATSDNSTIIAERRSEKKEEGRGDGLYAALPSRTSIQAIRGSELFDNYGTMFFSRT